MLAPGVLGEPGFFGFPGLKRGGIVAKRGVKELGFRAALRLRHGGHSTSKLQASNFVDVGRSQLLARPESAHKCAREVLGRFLPEIPGAPVENKQIVIDLEPPDTSLLLCAGWWWC